MAGFAGMSRVVLIALLVCNFCILATLADDDEDDEKHDYTIDITHVGLEGRDRNRFGEDTFVRAGFYNDTTMALQALLHLTKELPKDLLISLIVSQQDPKTNIWAEKIQQSHTFCDYIEKNTYFVNNVYRDTNFPTACPIGKGKYHINNMVIDNSEFPKHLEETKWKAEIQLITKDTKQSILGFVIQVDIVAIDLD